MTKVVIDSRRPSTEMIRFMSDWIAKYGGTVRNAWRVWLVYGNQN